MLVKEKGLTKIEEIVLYLQNNKEKGFYGKITETYEAGKIVNRKIEISVKETTGKMLIVERNAGVDVEDLIKKLKK